MSTIHRSRATRQGGLVARRFRNTSQAAADPTPAAPARRQPNPRRIERLPAGLTVAGVAAALAEYKDISQALGDLEKRREQLCAHLDGLPAGLYENWSLSWGTPREIVDHEATTELLNSLGHEVPKRRSKRPIQVDYVPQVHTD